MFSYEIYKIAKNSFFYRTAIVVAFEVKLAFSKESQTKTDATVSNTYQI